MPADVFFWPLPAGAASDLAPPDPRPGLRRLVAALGFEGAVRGDSRWPLHVALGPPQRPPAVAAAWAGEIAAALAGEPGRPLPAGIFAIGNLSIATRGLDTVAALREVARTQGFDADADHGSAPSRLRFIVGDDPLGPSPLPVAVADRRDLAGHAVAGALSGAAGLAVLSPVRPHPHLGVVAAVAALGLDLAVRDAKLALHRGIRPQVDTPLCAGCGSCLDVCLYDAIVIRGGRALIDHRHCTGCGECQRVCFMAGIAPEAAAGPTAFREAVAAAAAATAGLFGPPGTRPLLCVDFLVRLDEHAPSGKARRRLPVAGIGILASRDPVAVDAAAFDLLGDRLGGPLASWSGYTQEPGLLLERAESQGLGSRAYRLREV